MESHEMGSIERPRQFHERHEGWSQSKLEKLKERFPSIAGGLTALGSLAGGVGALGAVYAGKVVESGVPITDPEILKVLGTYGLGAGLILMAGPLADKVKNFLERRINDRE